MNKSYFCTFGTNRTTDNTIELDVNQIVALQEHTGEFGTYTFVWMRGCGNTNPFNLAATRVEVIDAIQRAGEDDGI